MICFYCLQLIWFIDCRWFFIGSRWFCLLIADDFLLAVDDDQSYEFCDKRDRCFCCWDNFSDKILLHCYIALVWLFSTVHFDERRVQLLLLSRQLFRLDGTIVLFSVSAPIMQAFIKTWPRYPRIKFRLIMCGMHPALSMSRIFFFASSLCPWRDSWAFS